MNTKNYSQPATYQRRLRLANLMAEAYRRRAAELEKARVSLMSRTQEKQEIEIFNTKETIMAQENECLGSVLGSLQESLDKQSSLIEATEKDFKVTTNSVPESIELPEPEIVRNRYPFAVVLGNVIVAVLVVLLRVLYIDLKLKG